MSLVIPPQIQTDPIWWAFPFSQVAWAITPPTVQDYILEFSKNKSHKIYGFGMIFVN